MTPAQLHDTCNDIHTARRALEHSEGRPLNFRERVIVANVWTVCGVGWAFAAYEIYSWLSK